MKITCPFEVGDCYKLSDHEWVRNMWLKPNDIILIVDRYDHKDDSFEITFLCNNTKDFFYYHKEAFFYNNIGMVFEKIC